MDNGEIQSVLKTIGTHVPPDSQLILVGGSALALLGSPRSAVSKIDRGADTDYDDLLFLIQNDHIDMAEFERMVRKALPLASQFDFDPDILEHLQELKNRLD